MTERYTGRSRAITAFVLSLGLGAVGGAGYWSGGEVVPYVTDQLGKDWEQFLREFSISDDVYIGTSAKIGFAATQCFMSAGGKGISRVVPISGSDERMVTFRYVGNESIDPKSIETCIHDVTGGYETVVY